ncbi:glyoxalase [Pseudotenacibaculum sp. MALMAid0570]|uniref:glyoxalase n=1 Tax=Pseudotenacibaculum sp. MALMAid0570 TaxID=3143938 RepID=UPI0032DEE423
MEDSMDYKIDSVRPFIGAKDFDVSRTFYKELGFTEVVADDNLSFFGVEGQQGFYLQRYYVEEWVANSMIVLSINNIDTCWKNLVAKDLESKYDGVKLIPIRNFEWGRECFVHDPSGILLHFCEFKK